MSENENASVEVQSQSIPQEKKDLMAQDSGLLTGGSLDEQWRMATAFAGSGMLPKAYHAKPAAVLTAMQFAYELGLKPLTAMRQLAVINGTPSMYGDLPLSLCLQSNKLVRIREWLVDETGKEICMDNENIGAAVFGAFCETVRKGDEEPHQSHYTLAQAKNAGLYPGNVWSKYPERMLKYRARSQNLKDRFADVLNGISIAEYDHDIIPDSGGENIQVDNAKQDAVDLTQRFS